MNSIGWIVGHLSIRQLLGQKRLPIYVGAIESKAPYRPEK